MENPSFASRDNGPYYGSVPESWQVKPPGKRNISDPLSLGILAIVCEVCCLLLICIVGNTEFGKDFHRYTTGGGDIGGYFILFNFLFVVLYVIFVGYMLIGILLSMFGLGLRGILKGVKCLGQTREPCAERRYIASIVLGAISINAGALILYFSHYIVG